MDGGDQRTGEPLHLVCVLKGAFLFLADASGAGQTLRLHTSMELGVEANRVRARHVLRRGELLWCALSWAEGLAAIGVDAS